MEEKEAHLTHKRPFKKIVARDDFRVPVIQEEVSPVQEGYKLRRMRAFTNFEITSKKLLSEEYQDEHITQLMESISTGYERANKRGRRDMRTQTDLKLFEMDGDSMNDFIEDAIFESSEKYDFKDVYTSEDEEFASLSSEQSPEMANLEDCKKMLTKTAFGIRTDPVNGKIILTIYDENGEVEIVPIGRGLISEIKVSVNPKWADYPELLITDSDNEIIHPKSYSKQIDNYDKANFDKINVRAVEVTNLLDRKYVDESFSDIEWRSANLQQVATLMSSPDVFSESEEHILPKIKKSSTENRKKRRDGKPKLSDTAEPVVETDVHLQADPSVQLAPGSMKTEYCSLSDNASHPTKMKVDSREELSSGNRPDEKDTPLPDDEPTDAEVQETALIEESQPQFNQSLSKVKKEFAKDKLSDQKFATKEVSLKTIHDKESQGPDENEIKMMDKKSNEVSQHSQEELLVRKDEKPNANFAIENHLANSNLSMETGIHGDNRGFEKVSDSFREEREKLYISEGNQIDSELSSSEEKIIRRKRNFMNDSDLFDKEGEAELKDYQIAPNLFRESEEESKIDNKRVGLESNENSFNRNREGTTIFESSRISDPDGSKCDTVKSISDKKLRNRELATKSGQDDGPEEGNMAEAEVLKQAHFELDFRPEDLLEGPSATKSPAETFVEEERQKTETGREESTLTLNLPAASTQTSSPVRRSSVLETLQRVEEEMRPLKDQLAEIQRQMWEIDASYPGASTDTSSGRRGDPNSSISQSPRGLEYPKRTLCKCPPGECQPSPHIFCRKVARKSQLNTHVLLSSLPTCMQLASMMVPPRSRAVSNPAGSPAPDHLQSDRSRESNNNNK